MCICSICPVHNRQAKYNDTVGQIWNSDQNLTPIRWVILSQKVFEAALFCLHLVKGQALIFLPSLALSPPGFSPPFIKQRLANSKAHTSRFISANLPCNKFKNRLVNIMPFESTRVCLQPIRGVEGSDYINASCIDGYRSVKDFFFLFLVLLLLPSRAESKSRSWKCWPPSSDGRCGDLCFQPPWTQVRTKSNICPFVKATGGLRRALYPASLSQKNPSLIPVLVFVWIQRE